MYLKALELTGFKSFADKTIIDFTKGITSIVGPNGSGKSNILDGILWVLGEQSYKNIRAKESSDVIFSGGKNKKAKSMAEVSLLIDNEDGFLDIDSKEVKITRRIYKNGENEYLINNTKTRLKDINNMFMDTGIGKQAYSIIGQGRVERIISSNPRELKEIMEEAAGVKRAKQEKDNSIKKLNELKTEIEKIDLVIKEKEKLIDTLKEEEKKVQLNEEYTEKINLYSTILYDYRIDKLNNLKFEIENVQKEEKLNIENLTVLLNERNKKQSENDGNFELLNNILLDLEKNYEKNVVITNDKKDKIVYLRNKITNIDVEKNEKKRRYNIVLNDITEKHNQLLYLKDQMEILTKDFQLKKEERNNLKDKVDKLKLNIDILETKIKENTQSTQNYEIEQIKIIHENEDIQKRINTANAYISRLNSEYNDIKHNFEKNKLEFEKLKEQKEKEEETKISFEKEIQQLRNNIENNQSEYQELNKKINSNKYNLENLKSKQRAVENIINSNETFYKGVQYVLSQNKKGVLGAFVNLINVPKGYEMAFQTLSGANFQDIVVQTADVAKSLIESLKKSNMGRASFIPMDTIKVYDSISNISKEKLEKIDGFIGFAKEIITYDKAIQKVINFVFGNAILVMNMDVGVQISKMGFKDKIVTLDGDIITVRGRMTGGSVNKVKDEILFRKNELSQIITNIEKFDKELKSFYVKEEEIAKNIQNQQDIFQKKQENYKLLKNNYQEILEKYEMHSNSFNKLEKHLFTINYEISESKKDLDNRKNQIIRNENKFTQNKEIIENNNILLEKLLNEKNNLEDISVYNENLNKLNTEYEIIKVKYDSEKNNYESTEKDYKKLLDEKNNILIFDNESNKIKEDIYKQIDQLEKNYEKSKELQVIYEILLKYIRNTIKSETDSNQQIIIDTKEKEFLLQNKKENLKRHLNKLDKIIQNIEKEKNKVAELDLEENRNHREYYELADDTEEEEIATELSKLDRNRMLLGVIDFNKVDIYKKTKELYDELIVQRNDLFNSRNIMIEFITGIEKEIETKFDYAFKEINKNFEYMCKTILNDARGSIRLTDVDNLLDTGVELSVKYKNKPEQTLMLLSGGEKSMLAVSFIMAIFLFKPSPFTFFDEIEAALDEANTKKIIEILKEFTEKSQFILITHNKETMKGSDRLYGITMNKEVGESKIIMVDI